VFSEKKENDFHLLQLVEITPFIGSKRLIQPSLLFFRLLEYCGTTSGFT